MRQQQESPASEPLGIRLTLKADPSVMTLMDVTDAHKLCVLPLCRIGKYLVIITKSSISESQAKEIERKLNGRIYPIPSQILDMQGLLNQALESVHFRSYFETLREVGHFAVDFLPTEPAATLPLREALSSLGLMSEQEAKSEDGEAFDASLFIDPTVPRLIPGEIARKHQCLPLRRSGQFVWAAVSKDLSRESLLELENHSKLQVKTVKVESDELQAAIDQCYRRVHQLGFQQMRLGEILLARGVVTRQQLETALEEQKKSGKKLGETLVLKGFATEEAIYSALAEKMGYEYQTFNYVEVDREASRVISRRFAESHQVLPSKLEEATRELVVATANPQDLAVIDLLKKLCQQRNYRLKVVVASPTHIEQGINYVYNTEGLNEEQVEIETVTTEETDRSDLVPNSEMPHIKKILNQLLYQAVVDGASDIHIENLESRVRVRFRIDGILQLRETPITKDNIGQVISVLKIDSGLDITERRRPQDGVFKKRIGRDWYIDFRLNVHCTQFGADAVIRILDSTKKLPKLDELGLSDSVLERFLKLIQNPQGLILITGPTGSGKSTTLYSTLSFLNLAERKIVTAEDPIEYHLDGICQYQVNDQIGNTFGEYGRRFLRKDPDIILIGETRDEITAEACLRAAMTGHMVFSTLHTNNSTGAVSRLMDLKVDSSLIGDALLAVVAQRLVRKNCAGCAEPYQPSEELLEEFYGENIPSNVEFLRGSGCDSCHHTGYRSRIGVFEFWELDRESRYAVLGGAEERELKRLAAVGGMKPLIHDALSKVRHGVTTLEELRRVVPLEQIRAHAERKPETKPAKSKSGQKVASGTFGGKKS